MFQLLFLATISKEIFCGIEYFPELFSLSNYLPDVLTALSIIQFTGFIRGWKLVEDAGFVLSLWPFHWGTFFTC